MKLIYFLYVLFFYAGWSLKEVWMGFTPLMIKYAILGIIVPIVAAYMLFTDPNQKKITIGEIIFTMLTSLVFVWLGYQANIELEVPTIFCLITSFILGLYALPIVIHLKKGLFNLLDVGFESAGNFIKKFLNK